VISPDLLVLFAPLIHLAWPARSSILKTFKPAVRGPPKTSVQKVSTINVVKATIETRFSFRIMPGITFIAFVASPRTGPAAVPALEERFHTIDGALPPRIPDIRENRP